MDMGFWGVVRPLSLGGVGSGDRVGVGRGGSWGSGVLRDGLGVVGAPGYQICFFWSGKALGGLIQGSGMIL